MRSSVKFGEDCYIGEVIANYRIVSLLKRGGFASVYKGKHILIPNRVVAIKILHTSYIHSVKERDRFLQEAQFLGMLNHPYILKLIDAGVHEDLPYLITEYISGGSLQDYLDRQSSRTVSVEDAVRVLTQIGEALNYIHQRGIIHCDIKPANILLNTNGDVVLADFGIATLLSSASTKHTTTVIGSIEYMAPEQFKGTISKEGDQYALGCIAYSLLTGHPPFRGPDAVTLMYKHCNEEPVALTRYNPGLPSYIEQAVLKSLAKQPTHRHICISVFLTTLSASSSQGKTSRTLRNHKEFWLSKGYDYYKLKHYRAALDAFDQAIKLDPSFAQAYYCKGFALQRLGQFDAALTACNQSIRLNPTLVLAYYSKGRALNDLKRHKEALAAFELAIRIKPNYVRAYNGKGNVLFELGYYKEALATYEQIIQLDPSFAAAYHNKELVLKYLEAIETYELTYNGARQFSYSG